MTQEYRALNRIELQLKNLRFSENLGTTGLLTMSLAGEGAPEGCSEKMPVVAALLDLHTGPACSEVNFHGLQQLAALRSSLAGVNWELRPEQIQINLQVIDSCSSVQGARVATLKALVASEQVCLHPPLFLGILGNERKQQFQESYSITKVFNIAHVLPYILESDFRVQQNVHYISTYPVRQHTQAMKLLLMKIGMGRIALVFDSSIETKVKALHMSENLGEYFCFVRLIQFADPDSLKRQLGSGEKEDALVLITEEVSRLNEISEALKSYEKEVVLSVGKLGVQSTSLKFLKDVYILQMTSATPLENLTESYDRDMVKDYNDQQMKKCLEAADDPTFNCSDEVIKGLEIKEKDWTTDLYQYGLSLYGATVRLAAGRRCRRSARGPCPELATLTGDDWAGLLAEASTFSKNRQAVHERITFSMHVPPRFIIYLAPSSSKSLISVGSIWNNVLQVTRDHEFPRPALEERTGCEQVTLPTTTESRLTPPNTIRRDVEVKVAIEGGESGFVSDLTDLFRVNLSDYETIGFVAGVSATILFLLVAVFCGVYRTTRVKSSRSSTLRDSIRTTASE